MVFSLYSNYDKRYGIYLNYDKKVYMALKGNNFLFVCCNKAYMVLSLYI